MSRAGFAAGRRRPSSKDRLSSREIWTSTPKAHLIPVRHGTYRTCPLYPQTRSKIIVKPWDSRANGDARISFAATRRPRSSDSGQDLRDHELTLAPSLRAQGRVAGQNGKRHAARGRGAAHAPLRARSSRYANRTGVEFGQRLGKAGSIMPGHRPCAGHQRGADQEVMHGPKRRAALIGHKRLQQRRGIFAPPRQTRLVNPCPLIRAHHEARLSHTGIDICRYVIISTYIDIE